MKTASAVLPPYVDTETPPRKWYIYHGLILVATLGMLAVAALVIEYEMAKLAHPEVVFLNTPTTFDLIAASLVVVLAFINLGMLTFIFLRHLWLRRWLLGTTLAGWMILSVIAIVLKYQFLQVLLPWYRPTLPL